MTDVLDRLGAEGLALIPAVYAREVIASWLDEIGAALQDVGNDVVMIRGREGAVTGARNVLEWFPRTAELWRVPALLSVLESALGSEFGLVRVLYFDKPPEHTWSLPWHKDLTIAVREHVSGSERFSHPTRKAGVPHVEAPRALLERMLTLRVHLDDVTDDNGPLRVVPGSHREGKQISSTVGEAAVLAGAGDVLAMRPLVTHASGPSTPGTARHRRILHLEFAADRAPGDGFAWHTFLPGHRQP